MNINFRVTNQKLVRTSFEQIVENSINYLFCNFEFSEDWNECSKNAYFSQNGTIWYVSEVNDENICEIPIEVIKHTGFRMYLVARDVNNNMKITTNIINLNVELSGNGEGEKPSITDINSDTLNIERQGNIVKIEIRDDYTTDEELQNAINDLETSTNEKLTNYYTKSEVDEIKNNINENINNEKQELTSTIESVNSTLNTRIDNLSSSQEKALENAINDVKNDTANNYTTKVEYNTHKSEFEDFVKNVNALLSSDDTTLDTLQEIVNYIKNNKDLLDGITVNKINYSDIVDNLQTALTNKVLSANQGVVLKQLIDELNNSKVDKESGKSLISDSEINRLLTLHNYDDTEIKKSIKVLNEEVISKATQIKTTLDTSNVLYDKLNISLLDKNDNVISSDYVNLRTNLLYSRFTWYEDNDTVDLVEGECAGKTTYEEKLNCFPFNEMYRTQIQLQDSNGVDLEGLDDFVAMPNIWLKTEIHSDGKGWTIAFSNRKLDNDFKKVYNSNEITEVLLARYKANKVGSYARSQGGYYPIVNTNQTNFDNLIPYYKGQKIDSNDYRARTLYALLNVCFTGHRNSQNIYRGVVDYEPGDLTLNQYGDSLKNGTTDILGNSNDLITGEIIEFNGVELANGKRPFSVLGIENPYGLIWENITGIVHNSEKLYTYNGLEHMTPAMINPSDSNTYYEYSNVDLPTSEGWQNTFNSFNGYPFPITIGGSSSKNIGDYYYYNENWKIFFAGGNFYNGLNAGLFYLHGSNYFGNAYYNIGFRLSLKR